MARNRYEKSERKESAFAKLLGVYFGPFKGRVIIGILCSIIGCLLIVAGPMVLKEISVLILKGSNGGALDQTSLLVYSLIALGCYVLGGVFQYIQTYIIAGCVSVGNYKLRLRMINKINHLPLNYFDTRNIGDVLSYATNDIDIIGITLNESIANAISSVVTIIAVVVVLFVLEWRIALAALLVLPLIMFVLIKVGSASQKYFLKRGELTSKVSSNAEESFTGNNILRVFNAQERNNRKFGADNYELEKVMAKADFYASLPIPLTTISGNLLFCVMALVGGVVASSLAESAGGKVPPETIAMIVAAVSYGEQLLTPLTQTATMFASLQQTVASAERVFTFLGQEDEPDESHKTIKLDKVEGNIEFDHVKFGYVPGRIIVKDFSQVGKHGQKIAIVGPTGAGKTTMVNLLMRFYELNSGKITIDGVDTKSMNRSYARSLFGMVLQDTWLFEGTIMENLKYSRPEATDEEVFEACRATHCENFILQQSGGYDHIMSEDCGLSAGQKQLLTIARAMIQNAPMLILDEATSNVDTRTELQIQDAMDKLMKGRTSFVIAHRLSTIKNSDLIIVMKDGDVIETGNHDELMKQDGFYAALYNSQFTGKGPQFS